MSRPLRILLWALVIVVVVVVLFTYVFPWVETWQQDPTFGAASGVLSPLRDAGTSWPDQLAR
jgi:lipopolysaccharide export LptBFGC system permease protein LptF